MQLSDDSLYEAWVGGNFVKEGETCGDWLADYLEKQGRADEEINMVTIQGTHPVHLHRLAVQKVWRTS